MKSNLIKFIVLFTFTIFFLNSCNLYKRSDIKDNPVNVDERVKKNIQEGRGIRFGKGATRGGDFDFGKSIVTNNVAINNAPSNQMYCGTATSITTADPTISCIPGLGRQTLI